MSADRTATLPRLVAHRGAPTHRRENTLAAIRAAIDLGATAVEVDVRRSADGVPLLLHDPTLERMWGDPRALAAVPAAEATALGDGEDRIPTLAAALAVGAEAGVALVVDLTGPEDARVAAAEVGRLRDAGTALPAIEWCGHPTAVAAVRALLPDAALWLAWESLAPPTPADLAGLAPTTLNLDVAFLTPATVEAAHGLGLVVSCWTVDGGELARWAAAQGVDSITTNDLTRIGAALEAPEDDPLAEPTGAGDPDLAVRALELAERIAAEVIRFTRGHPVTAVDTKAHPADLVTDVDRLVEQHVRGAVRAAFPAHGFVGEEFGAAPGDRRTWYLDPVDGTTNLANGIPWTSMSLCLADDGVPAAGVVADPWREEVLTARGGGGARSVPRDGAPRDLRLDGPASLVGAVVGTELDGHRPWRGFTAFLDALAARSCTLRVLGSGTLTLAQVAAGRGVGACVSAFSPVDHGAAVLLVAEAGGVVATPAGPVDGFPPVGAPVLVAHPAVAGELHALWAAALGG